ncbi:hypothetical protein ACFFRR_009392 [Megaselia abdita]
MLSIMSKCHSSKGISFIHLNAQSLFAHIDDFREDMSSRSSDIALISESWLNSSHSDAMVSLSGYKMFRNDRAECEIQSCQNRRSQLTAVNFCCVKYQISMTKFLLDVCTSRQTVCHWILSMSSYCML